jgi:hypothetical protein
LLFYWQMWRWVMDGSVHVKRKDLVATSASVGSRAEVDHR